MKNNLIYQVAVGDNLPGFYDITMTSVLNYAMKYDIAYIVQREPILKIRPLNSQRSEKAVERLGYLPIYEKENAFNYLHKFDSVCIIDADVYINNKAPNIFEQIDEEIEFAAVKEKDMPLTDLYINKIKAYSLSQYRGFTDINQTISPIFGIEFYNMGVMLMSNKVKKYLNGQTPEEFIRRKEFEKFVNGEGAWRWSTDQTLLNYWIKKEQMKTKDLSWKWNVLFKGVKDEMLSQAYFIHFFLANNLPEKGMEIFKIIKDINNARNVKYSHR